MSDHTKGLLHAEKWHGTVAGKSGNSFVGVHYAVWAQDNDTMICPTGMDDESEANARRIVACWNACDRISTADLEMDNVQFTNALRERTELRNQLAEARANDRIAMQYLAQVRAIAGGEDFPAMIRNVDQLLAALTKLKNECDGDNLGTVKAPSWTTMCEVAEILHSIKFPESA